VGCLKVPDNLMDEQVLFLSDILCIGWHAAEIGKVAPGDTVAVFGCGPVGLMAIASARLRGAEWVIAIDRIPYRLDVARTVGQAETINFEEDEPVGTINELTHGHGVDVAIDAVGFRYSHSPIHAVEKKLKLETDNPEVVTAAIRACRKGGIVSVVGDYIGLTNHFPIGAFMEKGLTLGSGQVHVQRYWRGLLEEIQLGRIDPTFVISHRMPLDLAAQAYALFDRKEEGVLKIILKPGNDLKPGSQMSLVRESRLPNEALKEVTTQA